jgi:hypothetical protein
MAAAHTLRLVGAEAPDEPKRSKVVRLVEVLGPISPELVLVDPELAPKARALLPELPWNWQPSARAAGEPISLRIVEVSVPAASSRWRLATVSAVAAAAAAAFGFGVSVAAPDRSEATAVKSRPPVATPVAPPAKAALEPAPVTAAPTPKPKLSPPRAKRPVPAPPRFVWPAVGGAKGYRIALYRGGRQVFEKDVASTGFQLPQGWTYQRRFYGLEKGTYRWVVWPLIGRKPNISQGPAIVSARYVV